jgi:DNA-binding XRE family transcriptional regulator
MNRLFSGNVSMNERNREPSMTVAYSIDLNLPERLRDRAYRLKFFWAETSAKIAAQLIELRRRRGLNQTQLAKLVGTKQSAILRAEQADYQNWNIKSIRKIAESLDARVRVLIEPSEDVIREYEGDKIAPTEQIAPQTREGLDLSFLPQSPGLRNWGLTTWNGVNPFNGVMSGTVLGSSPVVNSFQIIPSDQVGAEEHVDPTAITLQQRDAAIAAWSVALAELRRVREERDYFRAELEHQKIPVWTQGPRNQPDYSSAGPIEAQTNARNASGAAYTVRAN